MAEPQTDSQTPLTPNIPNPLTGESEEQSQSLGQKEPVISPNTYVIEEEGGNVDGYNSSTGSNPTVLAGPNYSFREPQPFEQERSLGERANKTDREAWGINTKEEKPTEIIAGVRRFNNAEELARASKGYGYGSNREMLEGSNPKKDEADEYGSRQSAVAATYNMAERVKLTNNIKSFAEDLRKGRQLTNEEVDKLTEKHLSKSEEYKSYKASYEAKSLPEEDIKILLHTHFKDIIDKFQDRLKDSSGSFSSSSLQLDEINYLTDDYKDRMTKAYIQDRNARMDKSDVEFEERERARKIAELEKQFPGYGKIAFEAEQKAQILAQENLLLKEKLGQLQQGNNITRPETPTTQQPEVPTTPQPEIPPVPPVIKQESSFKEKLLSFKEKLSNFWNNNKAAIIGGCLGFATAVAGAPILGTVGLGLIVTGASRIGKAITESKYMQLENKAKKETLTPEETARMERNKRWAGRLSTACNASAGFLTGFGLGSALNYVVNVASSAGVPVDSVNTAASNNMGNGVLESASPIDSGSTIVGTGTESLNTGWFDGNISASNFGWDYQSMGWNGDGLVFGENGGMSGITNQSFFEKLSELVPREALMGQNAGDKVNQALRAIYNGANPADIATQTAKALGY